MPAAKSAIQPHSSPILFKNAKAFETWLKKNHATSDGLWLEIAKRGALEASFKPRAKAFFATINAANRYAVLWRIQTAVKAETRARRIAQLVKMLARGETIHIFMPSAKA